MYVVRYENDIVWDEHVWYYNSCDWSDLVGTSGQNELCFVNQGEYVFSIYSALKCCFEMSWKRLLGFAPWIYNSFNTNNDYENGRKWITINEHLQLTAPTCEVL